VLKKIKIQWQFRKISKAASLFLGAFGPDLTKTPNGHIQTDIAGAGAIAGLMLLRRVAPNLDSHLPGTAILSNLHQAQADLLDFMCRVGSSMDLDVTRGWHQPTTDKDEPLISTLELTRRLEAPLIRACAQARLPEAYRAHAAALTAMKLVAAGHRMQLLDQDSGKYLAFYNLVAGSKTVPYPMGSIARPSNALQATGTTHAPKHDR
jgi:hypothetical protein